MDENKELPKTPEAQASRLGGGGARFEEVLMRDAYEKISNGDYEAASDVFQDILRRFGVALDDSQKSLVHSELGTLYFWLGDYHSAQKHCENALAYGGRNDYAYIILGKIAVARFQFAEAQACFSKVSHENPGRPLGFCLVAVKRRDTRSAAAYLSEASTLISHNDLEYRVYAAYIQLLKGNAEDAVGMARQLVNECGRDPSLLFLLAELFMTAGRYGESVSAAKQAGRNCPENDQLFAVMAHAAYANEDFGAADFNASEAVRLNPMNAYAKTVLMKLAVRKGNYTLAESIGSEVLRLSPNYSLGHANLGDVYFIQCRYELAQIEYKQTMELMDSQTKGARLRQARMKFIDSDFAGAADILEHLVESYHTYYDDAMCDLALCYVKMGDEEKKEELMEKMEMRRSFYHRTEKILQSFGE